MPKKVNPLKMLFTKDEKDFLKANYKNFTTERLMLHINANRDKKFKSTRFRQAMYELGLTKVNMTRWKPEWVAYLIENYQTMGDTKLAKSLNKKFRLKLTKKNVNKKRRCLLGLNRTPEQVAAIIESNRNKGCMNTVKKSWETRGVAQIGETRIRKVYGRYTEFIKTKDGFVHNARFQYEKHFGPVPEGCKVYHKDCDRLNNAPENLIVKLAGKLTKAENRLHKINNDAYAKSLDKDYSFKREPFKSEMNVVKEGKIRVEIKKGLTVFVNPGTDIQKLKNKYLGM